MISDILSDVGANIQEYLTDMPDVYQGETRYAIHQLYRIMDSVRANLDSPSFSGQILNADLLRNIADSIDNPDFRLDTQIIREEKNDGN